MASESITTAYGDKFTVATQSGSSHILLRAEVKGYGEPFLYGLPSADFRSFVKACLRLDDHLAAQGGDNA